MEIFIPINVKTFQIPIFRRQKLEAVTLYKNVSALVPHSSLQTVYVFFFVFFK